MNNILKPLRTQVKQFSTSCVVLCVPRQEYGPLLIQKAELLNGIKVAATKTFGALISSCTIMFQAGSRFEKDDQLGATHFIRACSTASSNAYQAFFKMRVLQQNGVNVTCTTDRQTVAFTMRCPMTAFPDMKCYLVDMAARCSYKEWEVEDVKFLVRDDLARVHPKQRVLDMIQTASWTGPLANSMFCAQGRIDDMNVDTLKCFTSIHYKTTGISVASVGLPYEQTMKVAELLQPRPEKPEPRKDVRESRPRHGFEFYDTGKDSETWIAVAVPSCGTDDVSRLLAHGVIAAACGTHDMISGQHYMDRTLTNPLCAMAGTDIFTQYRAFTIAYSDTGLFGILARTPACSARKVAIAASEFLTNVGDLDPKQIEIGKARLKLNLAKHDENCVKKSEALALLIANNIHLEYTYNSLIDQMSTEDIKTTAKALSANSKYMSLAVVGDIGAVAHDKELICNKF